MFSLKSISHIGDILAIPFFFLTFFYFYKIKNKDMIERILMVFSFAGGVLDIAFTYLHFFT